MTPETLRRLFSLSNQLAETLMAAALCAEEIRTTVRNAVGGNVDSSYRHNSGSILAADPRRPRPLLDESTMRVLWKGRSAPLGHTLSFRLMERLSRRPNQYVTHLDLLREVWENENLKLATVRSVVRKLRQKLRRHGMDELADAIRGHNGRYILEL